MGVDLSCQMAQKQNDLSGWKILYSEYEFSPDETVSDLQSCIV